MSTTPTDEEIVAAREAIYKRQPSLVGKVTKSSVRDALIAARRVYTAEKAANLARAYNASRDQVTEMLVRMAGY